MKVLVPPSLSMRREAAPSPDALADTVLSAALQAYRDKTLTQLLQRRPLTTRWFARRWLRPVLGVVGESMPSEDALAFSVEMLLQWAISQTRPDRSSDVADLARDAWLDRTSWRPVLAVMCYFGFASIPDFRDRYRARPDEPIVDHLCGLWSVGPSTFYRYLDKGKRFLRDLLVERRSLEGERRASLRRMAQQGVYRRIALSNEQQRIDWHGHQATYSLAQGDTPSALWHFLQIGDISMFCSALSRFRVDLARESETDSLIDEAYKNVSRLNEHFEICLAQAALFRTRSAAEKERQAYESALRVASTAGNKLMLGIVYGALGRFYEPRDTDRAFACFEDSVEFLRSAHETSSESESAKALEEYVSALVKLGWLYVLRNDPRSRVVLEKAEACRKYSSLSPETIALLEQAWGEYWRRAGDLRKAIEHKHRALNIFERLEDKRQLLSTYNNLSLIYAEAKDFPRAIAYGERVVVMADNLPVDPYILSSALLNLGAAYFWQGRYDDAIEYYRRGLDRSIEANLEVHLNRAHYNLAEAYYKRFQITRDPRDEQLGDAHAAAAMKALPSEGDSVLKEATRNLKAEVLGPNEGFAYTRLLPEEFATHFDEMAEIQRLRSVLATPLSAEVHIRAHLGIVKAYLAMSLKERKVAEALISKHALEERFASELESLHFAFDIDQATNRQLVSRWQQAAADLLDDRRRAVLIAHLIKAKSISKSGYAEICSVGLATASKHLGVLAGRDLLIQTGKGPSTRYLLPEAAQ